MTITDPRRAEARHLRSTTRIVARPAQGPESVGTPWRPGCGASRRRPGPAGPPPRTSADVDAAVHWWAGVVGVPPGRFLWPTLKTHNPATVRRNVGESYRGCLVVYVPKSTRLYWRMEGIMRGIAGATADGRDAKMFCTEMT